MNDLVSQLLQLAPGMAAGLKGNGHGMNAFMESYQRTNALLDEQERRKQMDQHTLTRQAEQDELARVDRAGRQTQQAQQDEVEKIGLIPQLAQAGGTMESPDEAKRFIETVIPGLMKVYGQDVMGYGMPALEQAERTITSRQKRQVSEFVEAALKTSYVADNPDADPEVANLPEHIQKVIGKPSAKLSELQQFAQLPVGKPAGKTRVPAMPGSQEDFIQRKYGDAATADQILEGRKLYTEAGREPDKPTVSTGAYDPRTQRRIDAVIKGFDTQPIVKKAQTMSEGVGFANALDINTKNPSDDMALIYAFAKVMDPESVVREGEYATVQKYSQSWADQFGFDIKRLFTNTQFLTPQARKNMKTTLMTKFDVERKSYDNLRGEFGRRIDRITGKPGTGVDELTDYGAAFPAPEPKPDAPKPRPGTNTPAKKNPFRP